MGMRINLSEYAEGAVMLDGFESAIIGIVEEFGNGKRILYDKLKILKILMEMEMTEEEACDFFDYNIIGLFAGEQNAVFLEVDIKAKKENGKWVYVVKKD